MAEPGSQSRGCALPVISGIALFAVLLLGILYIFLTTPRVSAAVAPAPVDVAILAPHTGDQVEAGDVVNVEAHAFASTPIARVELYVNGQSLGVVSDEAGNASWAWQPLYAGVHTLQARAVSESGDVGNSAVVIVNVLKGDGLARVPAEEGQSLGDVAESYGLPPQQVADANPGVDPNQPLEAGYPVQIPVGGNPAGGAGGSPPDGPTQQPSDAPNSLIFWLNTSFLPPPASKPAAPEVSLNLSSCVVQLYITPQSGDAAGFNIYRLRTGEPDYHKIATIGPGDAGVPILWEDPTPPLDEAAHLYFAGAFNALGENASEPTILPAQTLGCNPAASGDLLLIHWQMSVAEPVDRYYCYQSDGDGNWQKVPQNPFTFFTDTEASFPQYGFPQDVGQVVIQMQCWGWLDGVLTYLGEGETQIASTDGPDEVHVIGEGFELVGLPLFKPTPVQMLGGSSGGLAAPFAMREAESAADCTAHFGNLLSAFVCDKLFNTQVKQYYILVWEWEPAFCWPSPTCDLYSEPDGYLIYEINNFENTQIHVKTVAHYKQKATAVLLPWGYRCYGVRAFVDDPVNGQIQSAMETYCPGEPPEPDMVVAHPSHWLTTGGQWIQSGDCDTYGGADAYLLANQNNGFGNTGEVLVGSYLVDDDEEDCYREGGYSGAVKFVIPVLPPGAVIQRAELSLPEMFTEYKASGVATNYKLFCVSAVARAKQDWTGLGGSDHFEGKNLLQSSTFNSPFASLSGWTASPDVDVTAIVKKWINGTAANDGFILLPREALKPVVDGNGSCMTSIGNMQLKIFFFAP